MDIALILVTAFWMIFAIYWIVSSFSQKDIAEAPMNFQRVIGNLLFGLPFFFLIRPDLIHTDMRIIADNIVINSLAVIICGLGLLICILARRNLAGNWSAGLDLKKKHELITTGPYQHVRHPIYTGYLMMFFGAALAVGMLGGFIGVAILLIGCFIRIDQEEKLMIRNFGKKYVDYKRRTGALIPKIIR